ncbi:MAG: 50S ribosomal protein L7/L12 [Clostridia bacterium]|nr:50S ribosomal protein L7/L12 [Clostridia bacterium]
MASEKVTKLIEDVKALTVLELSELVKALEEEFGVSAAAPVAAVVAGPAAAADAPAAEAEQTEFDVILKDAGPTKMDVIKAVKEVTGVSLMDAKKLVDAAPSTIKEKVSKEDADAAEAKLKAAGATVEIK